MGGGRERDGEGGGREGERGGMMKDILSLHANQRKLQKSHTHLASCPARRAVEFPRQVSCFMANTNVLKNTHASMETSS